MVLGVLGGGVGMGIRSTWWWCRYGIRSTWWWCRYGY